MEKQLASSINNFRLQMPARTYAARRRHDRARLAIGLGILGCLMGCQRSPYELSPTEGTVKIAGQPLLVGKVMFAPIAKGDRLNAGKPAIGAIQAGGHFDLSTYKERDGAIVGEHWVTIYGPASSSGTPQLTSAGGRKIERVSVPHKVQVVAGQPNHIDIELTEQELTKFARWSD